MPKNVLVADDSLTIRKVIALVLPPDDFHLIEVDNGKEAISKAQETTPDMVLADWSMPGKNGFEVCEALKKNPKTAHIPVLLLVSSQEPLDEARLRSVGADGYIAKPFESQALLDKACTLLKLPLVAPLPTRGFGSAVPMPPPASTPLEPASSAPPTSLPSPVTRRPSLPGVPSVPSSPGVPSVPSSPGVPVFASPSSPGSTFMPPAAQPAPSFLQPPPTSRPAQTGFPSPFTMPPAGEPPRAPLSRVAPVRPVPVQPVANVAPSIPSMQTSILPPAPPPARPFAPFPPAGEFPPARAAAPVRTPSPYAAPLPTRPVPLTPSMTRPTVPPAVAPFVPQATRRPVPPQAPVPFPTARTPTAAPYAPAGYRPPLSSRAPAPQAPPSAPRRGADPFGLERLPTPVPQAAPPPPPALNNEAALRELLSSVSKELLEKVIWEVVPRLAETLILKHIEQLIQAKERGEQR